MKTCYVVSAQGAVQHLLSSIRSNPKTGVAAFGLRGHGQSSLLNPVQSCLRKRMWKRAAAGNTGATITTKWNSHHLTTDDGLALPWSWTDTAGDVVKVRSCHATMESFQVESISFAAHLFASFLILGYTNRTSQHNVPLKYLETVAHYPMCNQLCGVVNA